MNISQHSFCPLGFYLDHYYNDSMELLSSPRSSCTILSPFRGSSFIYFSRGRIRSWSPLSDITFSPPDLFPVVSFVDFPKSVFQFSMSTLSSVLSFNILHIGF